MKFRDTRRGRKEGAWGEAEEVRKKRALLGVAIAWRATERRIIIYIYIFV